MHLPLTSIIIYWFHCDQCSDRFPHFWLSLIIHTSLCHTSLTLSVNNMFDIPFSLPFWQNDKYRNQPPKPPNPMFSTSHEQFSMCKRCLTTFLHSPEIHPLSSHSLVVPLSLRLSSFPILLHIWFLYFMTDLVSLYFFSVFHH